MRGGEKLTGHLPTGFSTGFVESIKIMSTPVLQAPSIQAFDEGFCGLGHCHHDATHLSIPRICDRSNFIAVTQSCAGSRQFGFNDR